MSKPVCLVDLDDTLFQTHAKLRTRQLGQLFSIAAVDSAGEPRSVMTQEQHCFVDWLLSSTHLIPVTARTSQELSRVNIAFHSWKIVAHGGVIMTPKGQIDRCWQNAIVAKLGQYRTQLEAIYHFILARWADDKDVSVKPCIEYDDVMIYLSLKVEQNAEQKTALIRQTVEQAFNLDAFVIHHNENNIHWLPRALDKGYAVEYLLVILRAIYGSVPVLGFGDSLNDYGFLQHCSWFGSPKQSQIASLIAGSV